MTAEQQWQHMWELQQLPRTPGTASGNAPWSKVPVTPRTTAFNQLHGTQEYYMQPRSPMTAPPQQQLYPPQQTYPPAPQTYSPPQQTYCPPQETYFPPQEHHSPPQQTYFPPPGHNPRESVGYAGVAPHGQQEFHDDYIYDGKGKGTAM